MSAHATAPDINSSNRDIWRLTWPQMLMMGFNFLIGFVDVYVAGRISSEAQAAMGLLAQCLMLFLVLAVAVSGGAVAAVGQSLGAGRARRAARYSGLCLSSGLALGLAFTAVCYPARDFLLSLLRVPMELRGVCFELFGIFLLLVPGYYLFLISNAVLRAYKLVLFPLWSMLLATALNAAGDFGLGLGYFGLPALGVTGIACSTFISITGALILNLFFLRRQGLLSRDALPPPRWIARAFPYIYKVAWPAGLMQVLWQSGYLVLFSITASLPVDNIASLAGMTAGIRIESALFLPGMAFNLTAAILISHCLGAGRPGEARRVGYRILAIGLVLVTAVSLPLWPYLSEIAGILTPDPAVRLRAVGYLRYNLAAIPFTMTSMILAGSLNGAGATRYNLAIFSLSIWGLRLPLAYLLGHVIFKDADGVWLAMLLSQAAQALSLLYVFHYKNWARFGLAGAKPAGTPALS
ncbi:MAG: MATE family efflux transporter [Desulfovibrionaceae bacterium]|nr:MATE family efflux transporter [Desulfovibrionaceae bacterium]MBF0514684.1 MATE family efflux transporter [Desulfovibrionaceae bacterium]